MVTNPSFPLLREPYESELEYFKGNPHVAGMATKDEKVIFNPFSSVHPEQSDSIYKNEASRVFMKKGKFRPLFPLSKQQEEDFKDYGDLQNIRETIAARALAGDESAGELNDEQRIFVQKLKKKMGYE